MAAGKCPMCESPCIVKIISTGDKRYAEVDVCSICGAMYPRGKEAKATRGKTVKKTASKPSKKPRKK